MVRPDVPQLPRLVQMGNRFSARRHNLALFVLHRAALRVHEGVGELDRVERRRRNRVEVPLAPVRKIDALVAESVPLVHFRLQVLRGFLIEAHRRGELLERVGLENPALFDFLLAVGRPRLVQRPPFEDGLIEDFVRDLGKHRNMPGAGIVEVPVVRCTGVRFANETRAVAADQNALQVAVVLPCAIERIDSTNSKLFV